MDPGTFAARYDAVISEPRMRRLYGASGYFNVGYWAEGTTDLVAACDRLVDEVAAAVPPDAAVIIDVGCGLGAGTRRLADRFPRALVVGANLSHWQLTAARERGVEQPVVMDAAWLAVGSGTADAVLAIESAQHFDTREAFFAETHRVLRPGGVLALADMLFENADPIGPWMLPHDNRVTTVAGYARALEDAGFTEVEVRDVTDVTWRPYCAAMRSVFGGHEDALRAIEQSLARYVLAFAKRAIRSGVSGSYQ
ncbi:MAG TPA: methyltransferase domain-containing protein [Longimicrobiaceae bacterium]|nr:methyltransferase domain-containing protein [Longimicrobiaceae bacterium]